MRIKVQNTKKLNLVIILVAIIASIITWMVEIIWSLSDITIILWPILLTIGLIGSTRFNYSEIINVEIEEKRIVLTRSSKSVSILYQDIIEVQRITNYGKAGDNEGYHRVKIVTKRRNYSFYTNEEEQQNNTPFEITELGGLYYEFKRHQVKCC